MLKITEDMIDEACGFAVSSELRAALCAETTSLDPIDEAINLCEQEIRYHTEAVNRLHRTIKYFKHLKKSKKRKKQCNSALKS
jgi:hypothetical protein